MPAVFIIMDYELITTTARLKAVCEKAGKCDAIALDTEFVRTRTLTPKLGLLQLYDGEQLVLIDPLAIDDMSAFVTLLTNPEVVKVLHSCSEDLEAFLNAFETLPTPIYDTQFAAAILGMGTSLGYARLVEILSAVVLDKGESRTDWLARPLSPKQLVYAANDVLYLLPVYRELYQQSEAAGKTGWILEEMAALGVKKQSQLPLEYAYLPIKNNWKLNPRQLTVLQHLAAWRLQLARQKDIALNFVVKETVMLDIALHLPQSRNALSAIDGMIGPTMRRYGDTLVALVQDALQDFEQLPETRHLTKTRRLMEFPAYKKTLAKVKALAGDVAQENAIPVEVVASKKQMNQAIKWYWLTIDETRAQGLQPDLLSGWRGRLFGDRLTQLLDNTK